MSYLTDNPDVMLEALAVLVRKLGGRVEITKADAPGPFNLMSLWTTDGSLLLSLNEELSPEDVERLNNDGLQ